MNWPPLSAGHGFTLHDSEIKLLLYTDDLVLLPLSAQGLQQNLEPVAVVPSDLGPDTQPH